MLEILHHWNAPLLLANLAKTWGCLCPSPLTFHVITAGSRLIICFEYVMLVTLSLAGGVEFPRIIIFQMSFEIRLTGDLSFQVKSY